MVGLHNASVKTLGAACLDFATPNVGANWQTKAQLWFASDRKVCAKCSAFGWPALLRITNGVYLLPKKRINSGKWSGLTFDMD